MNTHRVSEIELDATRLQPELDMLEEFEYATAYSHFLCSGLWRSCMLWAFGGDPGDGVIAGYDDKQAARFTRHGERLPYIASLIREHFDVAHLRTARIARMPPDGIIIPHRDLLELDEPVHRVHVPLFTSERCFFSDENVVFRMRRGEVWMLDASNIHTVASFMDRDRVHLLLDFEYVDDADALVRSARESHAGIPQDSVFVRPELSDEERRSLLSLASILDRDNLRDIIKLVVKMFFRKDGGDNFVWNTLLEMAEMAADRAAASEVHALHEYYLVARTD